MLGTPDPVQWMTVFANLSSIIGMLQGNVPTIVQNFGRQVRALGFVGNVVAYGTTSALIMALASDAL